jgi:rod shape-determining protein MreC
MARLIRADQRVQELEDRWNQDQLNRAHLRTLEDENHRLRQLLGLPNWPRYRPVAARVWARDSADWFHSFLVRPSQAGVSAGAAVVAVQEGRPIALGQVREILPDGKARVLLLTDPFSALSAHVGRTGEQGLAEGRGSDRLLLNYLFSHSDVRPGDEVLTSGLGEVYPPNILIGQVEGVEDPAGASFRRGVVVPAARLGFLRDVLILERQEQPAAVRP